MRLPAGKGYMCGYETKCLTVAGEPISVELAASCPSRAQNNETGTFFFILRDITTRKQREDEIMRLYASLNKQVEMRTRELVEKIDELGRVNAELKELDRMHTEFISLVSHQISPLDSSAGRSLRQLPTYHLHDVMTPWNRIPVRPG